MFGGDEKDKALKRYEKAVARFEDSREECLESIEELQNQREHARGRLREYWDFLNSFRNKPKEFCVKLEKIQVELDSYDSRLREAMKELDSNPELQAVGVGGAVGLAGAGVAALGPTAAMSIAMTFGTASTGTAISTLSGAAATKAALAWLGGGALAAGGGMAAGNALLALAGPVGWGIAAVGVIGGGVLYRKKNLEQAEKANKAAAEVEIEIRKFKLIYRESELLRHEVMDNVKLCDKYYNKCSRYKCNYDSLSEEMQYELGSFVQEVNSGSALLNRKLGGM
ncbi:MAG: hypothetical protein K2O85_08205 [Helicobacter sp.]|nr:hypothetical protein [Helicobacter sp.]